MKKKRNQQNERRVRGNQQNNHREKEKKKKKNKEKKNKNEVTTITCMTSHFTSTHYSTHQEQLKYSVSVLHLESHKSTRVNLNRTETVRNEHMK